ncbi:deoxyhypusine hydroxylase-like [Uranotaenia lowii]|uniref:deoxyhypusine hydroxylase-like n=1 Tax=Uranotaenia lowii TaxID=190385 RepID=UPI0024785385|nr:deoxyhypusine hydroxylase-like [Uranotaenia lowii]XP_055610112.1 deoxyhypusine hydroxylase-like [Uranotaenia lowii]
MVQVEESKIAAIGKVLNDKNRPLKERFRALFTLKNIGGATALGSIEHCFDDDSALLKHELAYCLGQMQDRAAIPILVKVLEDVNQEPMVRHEAAEALGAIGAAEVEDILTKYAKDPVVEVAETCEIALGRIRWLKQKENGFVDNNPYASVDPTPPALSTDVKELQKILLDESETLFNRYRAMFSLRNLRTQESVVALASGLKGKSALFRHEVAFVLGQLQEECSIPFLEESLRDPLENEMVRHECAEALGAIATEECTRILNEYLSDDKRVVKESCEVALDMCEYEHSPEFQYADTLVKISDHTQ